MSTSSSSTSDDIKRTQEHASSSSSSSSSATTSIPDGWRIHSGNINILNNPIAGHVMFENLMFNNSLDVVNESQSRERKNSEESAEITSLTKHPIKYIGFTYETIIDTRPKTLIDNQTRYLKMFLMTPTLENTNDLTNHWNELHTLLESSRFSWYNPVSNYNRSDFAKIVFNTITPDTEQLQYLGFNVGHLYKENVEQLFKVLQKHGYITKEDSYFFTTMICNAICDFIIEQERKGMFDYAAKAISTTEDIQRVYAKVAISNAEKLHNICNTNARRANLILYDFTNEHTKERIPVFLHQEHAAFDLAMKLMQYPSLRDEAIELFKLFVDIGDGVDQNLQQQANLMISSLLQSKALSTKDPEQSRKLHIQSALYTLSSGSGRTDQFIPNCILGAGLDQNDFYAKRLLSMSEMPEDKEDKFFLSFLEHLLDIISEQQKEIKQLKEQLPRAQTAGTENSSSSSTSIPSSTSATSSSPTTPEPIRFSSSSSSSSSTANAINNVPSPVTSTTSDTSSSRNRAVSTG